MGIGGKKLRTQTKVISQISDPWGTECRGFTGSSGVTRNVLNLNLDGIYTSVELIKIH